GAHADVPDTTPPWATGVSATTNQVTVRFSEPISLASATNLGNYALNNGAVITSASLDANSNQVQLSASPLTAGQTYILSLGGIQDNSGNTITPTNITVFVLLL